MIDNQIIDIFYNQITKEAKTGRVDCFFMTNIAFDLTVNNQTKELCDELEYDGILIPELKINNKELFDSLLIQYVKKALETYDQKEFDFLDDVALIYEDNIEARKSEYLIKYIICTLFANMSYYDFENPISFLTSRINMFDNKILNGDSEIDLGYLESIGARIHIIEESSPIKSETPYRLRGYLEYDDGNKLLLPEIYAGCNGKKYQIYGIQKTIKCDEYDNPNYVKQIRKGFVSKINGTPEHYFLMLMAFLSLCQDKEIEVIPLLVERWNAKRIAMYTSKQDGVSLEEKENHQEAIQNNVTNVFIRNFKKLEEVSIGLNFDYVPFEIDDRLHVSMADDFESRAPVFNELFELAKEYKKRIKNNLK